MNWVDRKAQREHVLRNQANEVWQTARAAIQDACESCRTHYPNSKLEDQLENGHRIRITVSYMADDNFYGKKPAVCVVLVAFNAQPPCIDVTMDDAPLRRFPINADQENAFLLSGNERISADEFSRRVLEPAFKKWEAW
jgi:hypothetical protein